MLIRIIHSPSGELIAEGPRGWGITPFEGNFYISRRYLKTAGFKINFIPGLCPYKFLYFWMDFHWQEGKSRSLGWYYWLPNPLFPFIWFRVAVPQEHPELQVEMIPTDDTTQVDE
jgi:hypothetical protein